MLSPGNHVILLCSTLSILMHQSFVTKAPALRWAGFFGYSSAVPCYDPTLWGQQAGKTMAVSTAGWYVLHCTSMFIFVYLCKS